MPNPKHVPVEAAPVRTGPRIEYRGFENVAECREYRLRVHLAERPTDMRVRIPLAAFSGSSLRLQDGPDVCFQAVLRRLAAGESLCADVLQLEPSELQVHIETHPPEPPRWTSLASLPGPEAPAPVEAPVEALDELEDDVKGAAAILR